jgi:hypothetical protein
VTKALVSHLRQQLLIPHRSQVVHVIMTLAAEVRDGWPPSAVWLRNTLQRRVSLCGSPLAMCEVLHL